MKVYELVLERRIRQSGNSFQSVRVHARKSATDAIFILPQVQEKILEGNCKRYWIFIDLERTFARVPREVMYWSLRRKGVTEELIRVIKSMYDGASTTVRTGAGNTMIFEIRVGVHQGSCLSPLLFIIVMDAVSEMVRRNVPWGMLYADDLIVAEDSSASL